MSDLEKRLDENIESILKQVDERFTKRDNYRLELEERMEKIEDNINYARFEIQEQRLSELEKEIKNLHDWDKNSATMIAELRNLIQGNAISDLNHYEALKETLNEVAQSRIGWEENIQKQLNELKEAGSARQTDRYICDEEKDVFSALGGDKAALKRIQDSDGSEKKDALDSLLHGIDPAFLNGSEKKEVDCDDCKFNSNYTGKHCIDVIGLCNGIEHDKFEKKASGGEKSHIGNFSDVEKSKIADDSKPPELPRENGFFRCAYCGKLWDDEQKLISEFVAKLKLSLNKVASNNIFLYIKELIKEYEDKLK